MRRITSNQSIDSEDPQVRIAVDMDEVIADTHRAQIHWLESKFGYESLEDRQDELLSIVDESHLNALEDALHEGSFFAHPAPLANAQVALRELSENFELFVVTAAMEYPKSFNAKYEWLRRHFSFINPLNIVFCGDKSIVSSDYLVDDNVRHFDRFAGRGILFSAPHNSDVCWSPRVDNWHDVLSYFSEGI